MGIGPISRGRSSLRRQREDAIFGHRHAAATTASIATGAIPAGTASPLMLVLILVWGDGWIVVSRVILCYRCGNTHWGTSTEPFLKAMRCRTLCCMILALAHLLQRRLLDHVMVDTWPSIAISVLLRRLLRYRRFHGTLSAASTLRMIIFR